MYDALCDEMTEYDRVHGVEPRTKGRETYDGIWRYEAPRCPRCGHRTIPITYGYPDFSSDRDAVESDPEPTEHKGCLVSDREVWYCRSCDTNLPSLRYRPTSSQSSSGGKGWPKGDSAKLYPFHPWKTAEGFESDVLEMLNDSEVEALRGLQIEFTYPGLMGIELLAKGEDGLVFIRVEDMGAAFGGLTLDDWLLVKELPPRVRPKRIGRLIRRMGWPTYERKHLKHLADYLAMTIQPPGHLSYGLLLRAMGTASQALGHRASHAVMLLQSSGKQNERADDYREFIALFGCEPNQDGLTSVGEVGEPNSASYAWHWPRVDLHLGWLQPIVSQVKHATHSD